jgi:signal transduction histidine kinase
VSALQDAPGLRGAADRLRRRRASTLRTRTFAVIAVAVIIPCVLLSALGVYAYYRSWHNAATIYFHSAAGNAGQLAAEVTSLTTSAVPVGERGPVAIAIVNAFAAGHYYGATTTTMAGIQSSGLPDWAIASVKRYGYAMGTMTGPALDPQTAQLVAWRVPGDVVSYYTPNDPIVVAPSSVNFSPPVRRLAPFAIVGSGIIVALVLLGGVLISRSVVRPVRRVAEASARLAEGRGGEPVPPGGPREIRELAVSFNDMNEKLARAQEAEQAFLLSVSHELKTPLTSIRGYAEALDDGALAAPEAAAVIGTESRRLERLVGDLLDLARMRKSAFTVRHEPVDLSEVADEVAARYQPTAGEAGLTLTAQSRAASFAVGDHDRVIQVVSNLVENAIRSTPAGGTVSITAAAGTVAVADTGLGLTSDDLPRAFERFYLYSRHRADRAVGTGLGLAIVKELAEAMAGRVTVTSTVGVGTAFVVVLPAASSPAPASAGFAWVEPEEDNPCLPPASAPPSSHELPAASGRPADVVEGEAHTIVDTPEPETAAEADREQ